MEEQDARELEAVRNIPRKEARSQRIKNVVFDIGNVLVDWQPHAVWMDELGSSEAIDAFLKRIDFNARNLRCDHGETFADVAAELPDAEDARLLALYPSRFHLSVTGEVPGTWAIVDQLEASGVPLHAITNFSSETWPMGLKAHPRLGTMFGTTIVSGDVKQIKPNIDIYETFLSQSGLDKLENVEGAIASGMDAIHFTNAAALAIALKQKGLL